MQSLATIQAYIGPHFGFRGIDFAITCYLVFPFYAIEFVELSIARVLSSIWICRSILLHVVSLVGQKLLLPSVSREMSLDDGIDWKTIKLTDQPEDICTNETLLCKQHGSCSHARIHNICIIRKCMIKTFVAYAQD